jgi:hypothetical protein
MTTKPDSRFFSQVAELLRQAHSHVARQVNSAMVLTYFEIGRMIVEEEQKGEERAGYGEQLLFGLSDFLTKEFGKGFSSTNLRQMRGFYQQYSIQQTLSAKSEDDIIQQTASAESDGEIGQTISDQLRKSETLSRKFSLSWSHYLILMRIDDPDERSFYEIESADGNWSVRELKRQVDSALYQRLVLSRDKESVKKLKPVLVGVNKYLSAFERSARIQ